MAEQTRPAKPVTGFGLEARDAAYHFVVRINGDQTVSILERFAGEETDSSAASPDAIKVTLSAYRWERIATTVAQEFNTRLIAEGKRSGRWLKKETALAPYFGKELALLGWAVEDADATIIPMMVANWRGLAPEERWWFYTTINASSNGPEHGKNRGWRQAIKIAFTENPVHLPPSALLVGPQEIKERGKRAKKEDTSKEPASQGSLRLFDDI